MEAHAEEVFGLATEGVLVSSSDKSKIGSITAAHHGPNYSGCGPVVSITRRGSN